MACGLEGAQHRSADRYLEIGVLADDHRILPPHLAGAHLAIVHCAGLLDPRAHRIRASKEDHLDIWMHDQGPPHLFPHPMNQVQNPGWEPGTLKALDQLLPHQRCLFRGFEDHRVPLNKGRSDEPDGDGNGEVPGCDDRHHSLRFSQHVGVLFGDLRGNDLSMGHPRMAEHVLGHMDSLDDLGLCLVQGLARLLRYQPGHLVRLDFYDFDKPIKELSSRYPRERTPAGKSLLCRGNRLVCLPSMGHGKES